MCICRTAGFICFVKCNCERPLLVCSFNWISDAFLNSHRIYPLELVWACFICTTLLDSRSLGFREFSSVSALVKIEEPVCKLLDEPLLVFPQRAQQSLGSPNAHGLPDVRCASECRVEAGTLPRRGKANWGKSWRAFKCGSFGYFRHQIRSKASLHQMLYIT